jgi:hypothetical protein
MRSLIQRRKYADGWAALREVRGPFYDAYPEFQAIVAASSAVPHVSTDRCCVWLPQIGMILGIRHAV